MGLSHSPKVITNGLVFYMDQGNTQKSWKGAPATNLFTVTNLNNWSKSATTATSSHVTPHGDPAYDITDSNASGYSLIARDVTVANDSSSYTFSLFIKKTYGGTSAKLGFNSGFNTGGTQVAYNQRFNSDTGVANTGTVIDFGDWWYWYFTITNNSSGNTNLYCSFYPATGPYDSADNPSGVGTATIGGLMLVSGTTAVRFANSTRSNTQALLDLTGQNTITATSLMYASDGTFSFNGTNSYLSTNVTPNKNEGTISAFFKMDSLIDYNTIFDNAYSANDWECWVYASGTITFRTNADNSDSRLDVAGLVANTWYNVVITWTTNDAKMYINGVLSNTDSTVGTRVQPTQLGIGGANAGNTKMAGQIPHFVMYNRALTQEEVAQNFNALRGRYGI